MPEGNFPVCIHSNHHHVFLFSPTPHSASVPHERGVQLSSSILLPTIDFTFYYLIPLLFQPCIHPRTHPDIVKLIHILQLGLIEFFGIPLSATFHPPEPRLLTITLASQRRGHDTPETSVARGTAEFESEYPRDVGPDGGIPQGFAICGMSGTITA